MMTIAAILGGKGVEVHAASPDDRVLDVVQLLTARRIGAVPVIANGDVVGMFSERDVIRCVSDGGTGALELSIAEVMTAPAVTVSPDEGVLEALSLMTRRRIRHLPVVQAGRVIGIVSIGDLVKYRIDRIEAEAAQMRDYIQQA
jgi:CBS domain-containing protein